MRSFQLTITALLFAAAFAISGAMAFEVDHAGERNAASQFSDPDDNVPFPHMSDNGQPSNFQGQSIGNSGVSWGLDSSRNQPDAFQRAQERMSQ